MPVSRERAVQCDVMDRDGRRARGARRGSTGGDESFQHLEQRPDLPRRAGCGRILQEVAAHGLAMERAPGSGADVVEGEKTIEQLVA